MPWRDYILDRFWLKLFSFILATLIWFTITSNQSETRFTWNPLRPIETVVYERPVRLATLPMNRRFFNVDPLVVSVAVRGNKSVLNRITPSDIQAFVNLSDAADSPGTYPIEVRGLPRNVTLERVTPPMVLVEPIRLN